MKTGKHPNMPEWRGVLYIECNVCYRAMNKLGYTSVDAAAGCQKQAIVLCMGLADKTPPRRGWNTAATNRLVPVRTLIGGRKI